MSPSVYRALLVEEKPQGGVRRSIVERPLADLPAGDVLIDVAYSSLNYKDALSAAGHHGITRRYPHTPGIDAAGVVRAVRADVNTPLRPGDSVLVTGYDLGSNTSGGLAECIQVPAGWVVPLPEGLSLKEAMMLGTAGFTVALSLHRLEHHGLTPDRGPVVVTGATGGVGSIAVALLSQLGYRLTAVTGKSDAVDWLKMLGAQEVLDRAALTAAPDKPLLSARWAAGIDNVGGSLLAGILRSIRPGGAVAACGLAASPRLETTVYPFILRAVGLLGIASAETPMPLRRELWNRLAGRWRVQKLTDLTREIPLEEAESYLDAMLAGASRGRTLVRICGAQ